MAEQSFRAERDSMGEVKVPKGAYYGAQTQRAVENFPISGIGFPLQFIHALGMVKLAAARPTNNAACSSRGSPGRFVRPRKR
jgi:fumarate hydratase, class II